MSVVYVYGFVPSDAPLPERGLLGVAEAEVRLVELDGFAAAVSHVPAERFSGPGLEASCADVEWMAGTGLRHEQVVAWFVDHAVIVPSRLLTLFSSEATLREGAAAEAGSIRSALGRFDGLREWDLKVSIAQGDRLEAGLGEASEAIGALDREIESAEPGRRFLLGKKRAGLVRGESRAVARRLAAAMLDRLRPLARDVARLELQAEDAPVVLNAALLVPRDREPELERAARDERARLAGLGLEAEFTGPWAPYRFLDSAEPSGDG